MQQGRCRGLWTPDPGCPAQHVAPGPLLKPLTQTQTPHQTVTAVFEVGARHDARRTSLQAASSKGLAPLMGEGGDETQRQSWLRGPHWALLHGMGGGAALCPLSLILETKAKSSGEGGMGKLKRILSQALHTVAHIEFNRTQLQTLSQSGPPVPEGLASLPTPRGRIPLAVIKAAGAGWGQRVLSTSSPLCLGAWRTKASPTISTSRKESRPTHQDQVEDMSQARVSEGTGHLMEAAEETWRCCVPEYSIQPRPPAPGQTRGGDIAQRSH